MSGNSLALSSDLNVITAEIIAHKAMLAHNVFEIGARLKHARDTNMVHGQWEKWCTEQCGISPSNARKYIRVYDRFSNRSLVTEMGLKKMDMLAEFTDEELETPVELPNGEVKKLIDMSQKEIEQHKKAKREAEERANQLEQEKRDLERQLKNAIPADQIEDAIANRIEQYQEQAELEKQRVINEKNKRIKELESRKPDQIEVYPPDYHDTKRKLKEKEDELLSLTRSQLLQKDRFVVHDTLSNFVQSVGKQMKKIELEILKHPGDVEIHKDVTTTIETLERSIQEMKSWIDAPQRKGVVLDGDYTVIA